MRVTPVSGVGRKMRPFGAVLLLGLMSVVSLSCLLITSPSARAENASSSPVVEFNNTCGEVTTTDSYDVSWQMSDQVPTEYDLRIQGPSSELETLTNVANSSYRVSLQSQGAYTVSVQPHGTTGDPATCTIYSSTSPIITAPQDASDQQASVTFAWKALLMDRAPATEYQIRLTQSESATAGVLNDVSGDEKIASTTYRRDDATPGTWYWQVRAITSVDNGDVVHSAWSPIGYFTSKPLAPVAITVPSDQLLTPVPEAELFFQPATITPLEQTVFLRSQSQPVDNGSFSANATGPNIPALRGADQDPATTAEPIIEPTASGWRAFGVLWYWWLGAATAVALVIWRLFSVRTTIFSAQTT